jgi:hypothetical protein
MRPAKLARRDSSCAPAAADGGAATPAAAAERLPTAFGLFQLAALPDDAVALVLQRLHPMDMLRASAVSRGWRLAADRPHLWRTVAVEFNVELPAPRRRGGATRLSANLMRAFFSGYVRVKKAERLETERAAWRIWLKLHRSDAVALVKKEHVQHPLLASHRIRFYAERTLAMLAAWRGRTRVVAFLLEDCSADIDAQDDLGFTPLMMAAWAGRTATVKYLLNDAPSQPKLSLAGIPPQSSSCGGRGPFTAEVWARRKGFDAIANMLQAAAAAHQPPAQAPAPAEPTQLNESGPAGLVVQRDVLCDDHIMR